MRPWRACSSLSPSLLNSWPEPGAPCTGGPAPQTRAVPPAMVTGYPPGPSLDVVVEREGSRLPVRPDEFPLAPQAAQVPGPGARHHGQGGPRRAALEGPVVLDHEAP